MFRILTCCNFTGKKGTVRIDQVQWSDYSPNYGGLMFCTYYGRQYVLQFEVSKKTNRIAAVFMTRRKHLSGFSVPDKLAYSWRVFKYKGWISMMESMFPKARRFDVSNTKETWFDF